MITSGLVTIYVTDMERAVDFYTETLGLELDYRGGPSWAVVRAPDGFGVGLHRTMSDGDGDVANGWTTLGFRVRGDLDEVVAELQARGVVFVNERTEDTAVPLAYFEDPDGNLVYLSEERDV